MATSKKGAARAAASATTAAPAAPAAPAANPLAQLVQAVTAAPAAPAAQPKVHVINANGVILKAAHHVATAKGTKAIPQGGTQYQLTGLPYNPSAGHVNGTQWACVTAAITANGGNPVTVAQVAVQYSAAGLNPGTAAAFIKYRASGAKPNLMPVTA